jgi:aspartyl-tRNA(Asn)/glutamyl-tRNA(Gln) amidotransferase subunit B
MEYEPVIGLEVHAQLLTRSKIFCGCSTTFGEEPNTQTCPVCTGQPGSLPVVNRKAVEFAIKLGLATSCRIAPYSLFARKNYFSIPIFLRAIRFPCMSILWQWMALLKSC